MAGEFRCTGVRLSSLILGIGIALVARDLRLYVYERSRRLKKQRRRTSEFEAKTFGGNDCRWSHRFYLEQCSGRDESV
jgi:hypothetical protein